MPTFSKTSAARLATCHTDLQRVFGEVIKYFDCTIIEGHRGQAAQDAAFAAGKSKLKFPEGKHNKTPSLAVDAAPVLYANGKGIIDWQDRERLSFFAGRVLGIADGMGVKLRWGGDWDQDTELKDNSFDDLVHFELA